VFETSITLEAALAVSDVVVTGVPSPDYKLPATHLKEGVIAINFSTHKNMENDVREKSSIFVPSVGKVTVAMLERNLLRLHKYLSK
jgi:methylenetetrahydrofolate dehydrogenase (NAD+)